MLGSAVNPVLREGNSDRRVAASVKQYAKKHPHSMGRWSKESKTHVASMGGGDFYSSEQSAVVQKAGTLKIELTSNRGEKTVLKENIGVKEGEVLAAASMSRRALRDYYAKQIADAKAKGLLLSLHLKATMMKVSDPIMFGHAVDVYYQDALQKHADTLKNIGVELNNGIGDLYTKIKALPEADRAAIEADLAAVYESRPRARDGRLEQRHHESARAERRHHRRLDARGDSLIRPDVGAGRQAS